MEDSSENKIPVGLDFLRFVAEMEDTCERITDEQLSRMGLKTPKCVEKLGTVLSLVDRVGSCFWHCPGEGYDAHVIQYIAARAGNFGRAAWRLARLGFYDEALSMVRSLGEIANLLMLFSLDSAAMADWKRSDSSRRHNNFRPAQIRDRIVNLGGMVPLAKKQYHLLCELSTHPVPELRPQLFNPHGVVMAGGRFQSAGLLLVLNETAVLESLIVILAAKLCDVPLDRRRLRRCNFPRSSPPG